MKNFFIAILACLTILAANQVSVQEKVKPTIKFNGGSCQVSELALRPMFAPAEMKDNEKAFMVRFSYKLNNGVTNDALSVLKNDGQFVAPDGTIYKAGVSVVNEALYSLVVAVPKEVDVETLKFVYSKQSVSLK